MLKFKMYLHVSKLHNKMQNSPVIYMICVNRHWFVSINGQIVSHWIVAYLTSGAQVYPVAKEAWKHLSLMFREFNYLIFKFPDSSV